MIQYLLIIPNCDLIQRGSTYPLPTKSVLFYLGIFYIINKYDIEHSFQDLLTNKAKRVNAGNRHMDRL